MRVRWMRHGEWVVEWWIELSLLSPMLSLCLPWPCLGIPGGGRGMLMMMVMMMMPWCCVWCGVCVYYLYYWCY